MNITASKKILSLHFIVKSEFRSALADLLIRILSRRFVGKISSCNVFLSGSRLLPVLLVVFSNILNKQIFHLEQKPLVFF